jgi:hypothetical protein
MATPPAIGDAFLFLRQKFEQHVGLRRRGHSRCGQPERIIQTLPICCAALLQDSPGEGLCRFDE